MVQLKSYSGHSHRVRIFDNFHCLMHSFKVWILLILLKNYLFTFFCAGSSMLHVGYSLVVVHGLLIVAASPLLQSMGSRAPRCSNCSSKALSEGSVVVMYELSCLVACRIFLDQGLNLCPTLAGGSLTTGKTREILNFIFLLTINLFFKIIEIKKSFQKKVRKPYKCELDFLSI